MVAATRDSHRRLVAATRQTLDTPHRMVEMATLRQGSQVTPLVICLHCSLLTTARNLTRQTIAAVTMMTGDTSTENIRPTTTIAREGRRRTVTLAIIADPLHLLRQAAIRPTLDRVSALRWRRLHRDSAHLLLADTAESAR